MSVERAENEAESRAATRRGVLTGAGMVGATAFLTACGSEETTTGYGGGPAGDGAGASGGDAAAGDTARIVAVAEVPVGGGYIDADNDIVVTQPAADEWHAFSATCTHAACRVTSVSDGTINCDCHGSKFSQVDGSVVAGPAPAPLPVKDIAIEDGWVIPT